MCHKRPQLQITQAQLFAYQRPFNMPIQFKALTVNIREGLILQLSDIKGDHYFTEIAPLPAFSIETFAEVKAEMMQLLTGDIKQLTYHNSHYHSIQFALDSLFSPLTKQTEQQANCDNVPLLQGDTHFIHQQYQSLKKPNLIKLKVARGSVESDILNFQQLCQLNPMIKIRCDANQAWNKQQAGQFFSAINIEHLDYIEEPTSHHHSNLQLAEWHQFKLALDETLQQSDFCYQHHHCIKALIIKPTLIGHRKKTDQLVSFAKKYNLQVSFSSSFESALGLQQIKNVALHYQKQLPTSLGIDTQKYFTGSLLMDPKQINKDCLQLECLCTQHY